MDMEADLKKKKNICLQKQHLLHDTVDRETTNKAQKPTQTR